MWNVGNVGAEKNMSVLRDMLVASGVKRKGPSRPFFLLGASFGCRVIAHVLSLTDESMPPELASFPRPQGVLLLGYPFYSYATSKTRDPEERVKLLNRVRSDGPPLLLVSGRKDPAVRSRGLKSLAPAPPPDSDAFLCQVTADMPCAADYHLTPGGHSVLDNIGRAAIDEERSLLAERVVAFFRVGGDGGSTN